MADTGGVCTSISVSICCKKGRKSTFTTFIFLCQERIVHMHAAELGVHTRVLELSYKDKKIKHKSFALKMDKVCDDP